MARIRSVKPDAWKDPKLGRVSRDARLLWTVLLTMSDDAGRFEALPMIVVGHGYPRDGDALGLIPKWLDELVSVGLIVLYEADGEPYGFHPKWSSHQTINRPSPARFPAPDDRSASDHVRLTESSLREGKGEEGRGEEGSSSAPVPPPAPMPERADECARLLEQGGVVLLDAYFLGPLTEQHPDVDFAEVARAVVRKHRTGGLTRPEAYLRGIVTSDSPPRRSRLRGLPSEFAEYGEDVAS